ncbi:DUF4136 domain-containing protein [Methylotetracoccus oryzae]|uniref:DUF4136 domain-containing protein n=1 Tax=Methylotetracoccus oryzae TaxID=1919059 RepID=UPI001118F34B|nr:DUF4136 domain-containing protein [Methylotetracoccus oryzae]
MPSTTPRDNRRLPIASVLGAMLLALVACSSAHLTTDHEAGYDFARLHFWDWAEQSGSLETPAAVKTSERIRLDSLVRSRVDAALARKGYVRDRDKAQFRVAWSFGEWELKRTGSSASHYGAVGLYYPGLHASNTHTSTDGRALPPAADPYSSEYEQAKLDLVVIDAKTQRVIWHGNMTDKNDFGYYTSAQTRELGAAVESILEHFPPTP